MNYSICAIAWTEHSRSLYPRLLLRQGEREKKEEGFVGFQNILELTYFEILESFISLFLSLFWSFPHLVHDYASFSYGSSCSGKDFYRVTDEYALSLMLNVSW